MFKDTQPLCGEEMSLRPPQRWHEAIRSLPGNILEKGVFETSTNLFDTQEIERPFLYYFISVDKKDNFLDLEPGIYIAATIAPGVFEQHGGNTFQGIQKELMLLLAQDGKAMVTAPVRDLPELSTENEPIPEHLQDANIDFGNTIEVWPYKSFDISNQTEIPYEFMTFYRVSPVSLRRITDILSNPSNPRSFT